MARIWGNENGGKTATGMKFEGNVLAVPGKYKLGETYQLTFTSNGTTRTIDAVAVDRTSVSFAAPKNSELFHQVQGKDVEIKIKHMEVRKALPVHGMQVRKALPVIHEPAPVTSPSTTAGSDGLIKPSGRNLDLTGERLLIEAVNNGGAGKFRSAREIHAAPERAGDMAAALITQFPRPENKLEQLAGVFHDNPQALEAINQKYNFHLLTCEVSSLPGYHPHPGRERVAQTRQVVDPFRSNAVLQPLPPSAPITPPATPVANTGQNNGQQFDSRAMSTLFGKAGR